MKSLLLRLRVRRAERYYRSLLESQDLWEQAIQMIHGKNYAVSRRDEITDKPEDRWFPLLRLYKNGRAALSGDSHAD